MYKANHLMRNDTTGEVRVVRCNNEFTAYLYCREAWSWPEDYITFLCTVGNDWEIKGEC